MIHFYPHRNTAVASFHFIVVALGLVAILAAISLIGQAGYTTVTPANFAQNLGQTSLAFVPNEGQTAATVRFEARGLGGRLFFTPQEVVLRLPVHDGPDGHQRFLKPLMSSPYATLRLRFDGANPSPEITGGEQLPGTVSYFRGSDPAHWQTGLPTYAGVTYHQLYDGIDLHYDGVEGSLKGTFTVAPGVDPGQIRWRYVGAESVRLDGATGNLVITLSPLAEARGGRGAEEQGSREAGEQISDLPISNLPISNPKPKIVESAPVAWQTINGRRIPVSIRYNLAVDGRVGFVVGNYDPAQPLIIDPTLGYSSYLGGNDFDEAWDVAVDSAGNTYVVGSTTSVNFPTQSPLQADSNGGRDVFVAKFSPNGTRLYATYLGGTNLDIGHGVAVDGTGNAYITGETGTVAGGQTPFPTTPGAHQTTIPGAVAGFVTKLNPNGSDLVYSTFLGGTGIDGGLDIAVDSAGNAYVVGETNSSNLPLENPAQDMNGGGLRDAFVVKLNPAGSDLVYSTYLGGSDTEVFGADAPAGIAVDSAGHAYVTGYTQSDDFPTTPGAFDTTLNGGVVPNDPFVTKLSPDGISLVYSTYLGGNETVLDRGQGIAVDAAGNAYIIGITSAADFPIRNALQGEIKGTDAFITKLNPSGSDLIFSTFLGGSLVDYGYGIALDGDNNIYATGLTSSDDFPVHRPLQVSRSGFQQDVFIVKLPANGSRLIYSTYLGGENRDEGNSIAAAGNGNEAVAYVVGLAGDTFPTQNAVQAGYGGGVNDGFIVKIGDVVFDVYLPAVIK